jgi:hypothetical protein
MNAQPRVGKGAARVVSRSEIFILSAVLEVAPEWLAAGAGKTSAAFGGAMPAFWDMAADPKLARQMTHLMDYYEELTGETLVWGESLLCSLLPPEFAHAYHENYFAEYERAGLREQRRILVETYDRVGDLRRARLFGGAAERNFALTQIIFLSELEKLTRGAGNYRGISPALRARVLENLSAVLANESFKINLVVVSDREAAHLKHILRDYDRFGVNGARFSIWSYHAGKVAWSEDEKTVLRHRRILTELVGLSAFGRRGVLNLLADLSAALKPASVF